MPTPDLNNGFDSIKSQINAYKTFIEITDAEKEAKKTAGNSESPSIPNFASSLDKIAEQQKRFLRNAPTSYDQILNLLGITQGSGNDSSLNLRSLLIETSVQAEPKVKKILSQAALKALGCSQQQTYVGIPESTLNLNPLDTLPASQGIYVPLHMLDFGGLLKIPVNSIPGKIIFQKEQPNADDGIYRPYKGNLAFPMLKELNLRINSSNSNQSFYKTYGKYYQGDSNQKLFDFQFSKTNRYGVSEDCIRVALIDRFPSPFAASAQTLSSGFTYAGNKVYEFLEDYYSTIKIYDPVIFAGSLVNLMCGAVSMQLKSGFGDLEQSTKFELLLQRILGLCFDSRSEIDVSGISKIAELDGVDKSFFEYTEVDLRNIENRINNIQNNVVEFEDCNNVKLPVDYITINNELAKFRDTLSVQTVENQVKSISGILDTISNNPEWYNVEAKAAFDQAVLKKIPLALASSVLTPAVLLPIFTLIQVVQSSGITSYNSAITSANTVIQSANTTNGAINNVVNNPPDFLKVFEKFNIDVISKIGAIYIETLYEVLKKELLKIVQNVISEISKGQILSKNLTIQSLLEVSVLLNAVAPGVDDFRKCKSLVNKIKQILSLLKKLGYITIPTPLLFLSKFLPGTSAKQAFINTIEEMQKIGIPTGPLPDGSPNQMLLFNLASHTGAEKDKAQNNKITAIGVGAFGPVDIFGV
jgi:hypothetical protein